MQCFSFLFSQLGLESRAIAFFASFFCPCSLACSGPPNGWCGGGGGVGRARLAHCSEHEGYDASFMLPECVLSAFLHMLYGKYLRSHFPFCCRQSARCQPLILESSLQRPSQYSADFYFVSDWSLVSSQFCPRFSSMTELIAMACLMELQTPPVNKKASWIFCSSLAEYALRYVLVLPTPRE